MNTILILTRNNLGMTLREFASALGVSYETARLWGRGRMKPKADRLIEIYTECDDWRRDWAAQELERLYPAVWRAIYHADPA